MRIGSAAEDVTVRVLTEGGSAVAALNFEPFDERVTLRAHECMATIEVAVHPSRIWSPSIEFSVVLCEPVGGRLTTTHLHRCRCWIIHSGPFPSNETYLGGSRPRVELLVGFVQSLWQNDLVRRGTVGRASPSPSPSLTSPSLSHAHPLALPHTLSRALSPTLFRPLFPPLCFALSRPRCARSLSTSCPISTTCGR